MLLSFVVVYFFLEDEATNFHFRKIYKGNRFMYDYKVLV